MRSSSRRSLRRSNRTPREQFIALAGVAAGGPFLLSGFLLPVFPSARFPFRWLPFVGFLPLGFLSRAFLSLCLPERSRFATLLGRSIFRPFFGRMPSESGRDLPGCNSLAFCDQSNPDGAPRTVEKCHAMTAWHFATKTIGMDFPGWSGFATLLQPGVSRPFFSRRPSENGRDLPRCDSQANPDHFSRPAPPRPAPPCLPPDAPPTPPAPPRRRPPIGGPTQIETFVTTQDAQLFR